MTKKTIVLLALIVGVAVTVAAAPSGRWKHDRESDGITASGTIEAEEVRVPTVLAGRVAGVTVAKGMSVSAGEVLVRLDDSDLRTQEAQAQAAVNEAQANLDRLKAGATEAQVAMARAKVAKAQEDLDAARMALENAKEARDDLWSLEVQIHQTQAQIEAAKHAVEEAKARKAQAEAMRDSYRGDMSDLGRTEFQAYGKRVEAAEEGVKAAQAALDGALRTLAQLRHMEEHPLAQEAQVHGAKARVQSAEAALKAAQAELEMTLAGARREEVAVGEAALKQARAALALALTQQDYLTVTAPISGTVTEVTVESGEVVAPGKTLVTLADLSKVTLVVYVPEPDLGSVRLGAPVDVRVDAFPNRTFEGRVTHVATEAEFTPKNVQTKEERVQTVFAVKISIPNPEGLLKPGMPADATIHTR